MKIACYLFAGFGIVFGIGCLNYTKAFGVEHHYEFATENGVPEPSATIFYLGVLVLALSAGTLGFMIGNRQPKKM